MKKMHGFLHLVTILGLMAALLGALPPIAAHATAVTCYVDDSASGSNTGGSWTNAYVSLQSALASCGSIWVAAGVYKPGAAQLDTFTIPPGATVYGGFAGTESVLAERNPAANLTILSGDIDSNDAHHTTTNIDTTAADISGTNSIHVVKIVGTTTAVTGTTILDGFIITGGQATNDNGAGLLCDGSGFGHSCNPTLSNLTFSGNTAQNGGAIYLNGSFTGVASPPFTSVTFSGNHASVSGGAVFAYGGAGTSSPSFSTVTFSGNSSDGGGGAVYNDGKGLLGTSFSSPSFTTVTFSNNTATGSGGAVYNDANYGGHSSPTFSDVTFATNSAASGGGVYSEGNSSGVSNASFSNVIFSGNQAANGLGGAVYNAALGSGQANPTFTNVSFISNTANGGGGAVMNYADGGTSSPTFLDVTFNGNSAPSGGAVLNSDHNSGQSSPTFANVTFAANSATAGSLGSGGGAVYNNGSTGGSVSPVFLNVTFKGNTANSGSAGAMYNYGSFGTSSPTLTNVILWGDTDSTGFSEIHNNSATVNIASSVVQGGCAAIAGASCGGGNLGTDPRLWVLAANGGFTETIGLVAGSSAIDTGNNTVCSAAPVSSLDQRGTARPLDGDSNGTATCDIGAFEYDPTAPHPIAVRIGGAVEGTFNVGKNASDRRSFSSISNGPVQVNSTDGAAVVASERVAYTPDSGTTWTSYSELMGLPASQLTDTYYFPWYNSVNLSSQVSVGNVGIGSTTVTVTIGGSVVDSYTLAANASKRVKYPSVNNGPVVVHSSGGVPIISSERISYTPDGTHFTNYSELMGLPASQLTDTYYFSYYNSVNLSEQVSVGNVGGSSTTVTVTIGGNVVDSYVLTPNQGKRVKYPSLNTGPVVVHSSGGVPIISSERISFTPDAGVTYTGYSEMMGLPSARLTDTYAFPWYNSVDHSMQVSAANVGSGPTTVTVTINGTVVDSYTLAQNASKRVKYVGVTNGPVVVHSSGGIKIIASERTSYTPDAGVTYPSFSEMLGLPSGLLTDTYVFPWYNNVNLNTEVRFGVP